MKYRIVYKNEYGVFDKVSEYFINSLYNNIEDWKNYWIKLGYQVIFNGDFPIDGQYYKIFTVFNNYGTTYYGFLKENNIIGSFSYTRCSSCNK